MGRALGLLKQLENTGTNRGVSSSLERRVASPCIGADFNPVPWEERPGESRVANTKNSHLGLKQDGKITYWRSEVAAPWFPSVPFSDLWLLRCRLQIRRETKAGRGCPEAVQ